MEFTFGDIVVVEENLIGVVVKCWGRGCAIDGRPAHFEVYVRTYNKIKDYEAKDIQRYMVRHKELDEDEMYYQQLSQEN